MITNFQYQLQHERFDPVNNSSADMVVVDIDDSRFTAAQVAAISAGKIILSYLSIGQASDFRGYWDKAWVDNNGDPVPGAAPAWLGPKSPWAGSYEVRYWDPGWLTLMQQEIDRILGLGYAGVVYDVVDEFSYWEGQGIPGAQAKMKALVVDLMSHGESASPTYMGVPNAGVELLTDAAYRSRITAQLRESVFYDGEFARPPNDTAWATSFLDRVTADGKQVFDIEYPTSLHSQKDAINKSVARGYVPYTTNRALDTLAPVWQDVLAT